MIRFECDYAEGAHEKILRRLCETNAEQTPGYGEDAHCESAKKLIRAACRAGEADVHFLVGGTQTNLIMVASVLRPHQGAVAAASGHIAVHETGAVEAAGHKVLTLPGREGKISAAQVRELHAAHWNDEAREHMVQPGLVYISQPTECGTLYSREELEALSRTCRERGLALVLDGARLGYGLAAQGNDLALSDFARLCDMFSIGGTKVGALFGEAVVIADPALKKDFRYLIKQRGGMLAKGRLLGLQFAALFEDGLYEAISRHAVDMAMRIREAFARKGVAFRYDSRTNQQFPVLPNAWLDRLAGKYAWCFWEKAGPDQSVVRFCTSWATKPEHVEQLVRDIEAL